MSKLEETIRTKQKFLISTLKKSKRIEEMDARELIQLSGKAIMMRAWCEIIDDDNGVKFWETVRTVCKKRSDEIQPNKIKFYSTKKAS